MTEGNLSHTADPPTRRWLFFRSARCWSNQRWANTPKWLFGIDTWAVDTLNWGDLHYGWFFNPRSLTVGLSWEIISANWIGTRNELLLRIHPLPMVTLYLTYSIPERWVTKEVGTSMDVSGWFRH